MLSCKIGNRIINTIDFDNEDLRKWSNKRILKCPICDGKMIYRNGDIRVAHFSHSNGQECIYEFYENETKEHVMGKIILYKWLKTLNDIENLQLETWMLETKQRPDLYFEFCNNRYVVEYQCTPITLKEFKQRNKLYKLIGVKPIWIFGIDQYSELNYYNTNITDLIEVKNYKANAIECWFVENLDFIYKLDSYKEQLYLIYCKDMVKHSNKKTLYDYICIKSNLSNLIFDGENIFHNYYINKKFDELKHNVLCRYQHDRYKNLKKQIQLQNEIIEQLRKESKNRVNEIINQYKNDTYKIKNLKYILFLENESVPHNLQTYLSKFEIFFHEYIGYNDDYKSYYMNNFYEVRNIMKHYNKPYVVLVCPNDKTKEYWLSEFKKNKFTNVNFYYDMEDYNGSS